VLIVAVRPMVIYCALVGNMLIKEKSISSGITEAQLLTPVVCLVREAKPELGLPLL
jgi:hypothetical protein